MIFIWTSFFQFSKILYSKTMCPFFVSLTLCFFTNYNYFFWVKQTQSNSTQTHQMVSFQSKNYKSDIRMSLLLHSNVWNPEKWFEGYHVKSTQFFSGCSPDFFLIYKYDTQFFSGCPSEKNPSWPNPLLVTVLLSTTLSGYRKGVWSNPDIASSGIERGCQGCLVPAEFLDSTVWHPLILAILLHNVVFYS